MIHVVQNMPQQLYVSGFYSELPQYKHAQSNNV